MNATAKRPTITSVKIVREIDEQPDLSYLGAYSSHRDEEYSIDRHERGDMGRNEFRYFTPAMTGEETGNTDSPEQDYQRMEAYKRGEWWMVGIYAVAEIRGESGVRQYIQSGGLWGIESDSDKSYLESVAREELEALRDELLSLGFSARSIKSALSDVELNPR